MSNTSNTASALKVPLDCQTSHIYIDESGVASHDRFFVVGALKVRRHGKLMRAVRDVRDKAQFTDEFRFNRAKLGNLSAYYGALDLLENADIVFAACVVDREYFNPFKASVPHWKVHVDVTTQLLHGCINKGELVAVTMDMISSPPSVAVEDIVRGRVNKRLKGTSVVTAALQDSRAADGLQLVDLLAGAVSWERRFQAGISGTANSHKAKVVARTKAVLGTDLSDCRGRRFNITTYRKKAAGTLRVVKSGQAG